MGGSSIDNEWEIAYAPNAVHTLVLLGRTGNGKSATGNSILGKEAFNSKRSLNGVTATCELQTAMLRDGHQVNVIDTPGLFDCSVKADFIGKEIVKCINLAKDGIHAVVVVFSTLNRFSQEEECAILSLQALFGRKIFDYMIVVFTGGDTFKRNQTLNDYLGCDCPESLKEIFSLCGNRRVLFDNNTEDESKRVKQVEQLLSLVDMVIQQNGGQPFKDELFAEVAEGAIKEFASLKTYPNRDISEQIERAHDLQLEKITKMVEQRMSILEQKLADEQAARLRAEENAREAQQSSKDEIQKLRDDLEKARKAEEELRKRVEAEELRKRVESSKCAIL